MGQEHWWDEAGRIENEHADELADHYKAPVKKWWAENRAYTEARKPEEFQKPPKNDYQLPLGVERDGDLVQVPGTADGDCWTVDTKVWRCSARRSNGGRRASTRSRSRR
jgi:hypothetical protein